MKIKFKNYECDFDSEKLEELRENTKKESKQKNRQKQRFCEDDFFKQKKQKRK